MSHFSPVKKYPRLSAHLGVDLRVKHDDLFPFTGGGAKARKILPILSQAETEGANALVTVGAANSNHARVTAISAAEKGWKCIIVVQGLEDYSQGNLMLMRLAGAELRFVGNHEVAAAMDGAMHDLRGEGYRPYYIWGGGHGIQGMMAFNLAVDEFVEQAAGWQPDYVFHASGTGGTQAGLHVGFHRLLPEASVVGISVSRKRDRGKRVVEESVTELCRHIGIAEGSAIAKTVQFEDRWVGEGYAMASPELIDVIGLAARIEGLVTDPTYTGKAFKAIVDLRREGRIRAGQKVLFWHTGGLINLFSHHRAFLL